jgi:hypothetical protein
MRKSMLAIDAEVVETFKELGFELENQEANVTAPTEEVNATTVKSDDNVTAPIKDANTTSETNATAPKQAA